MKPRCAWTTHNNWSSAFGSFHSPAFNGNCYVEHAMGSNHSPVECGKSYVASVWWDGRSKDGRGERQEGDDRERDKWKGKSVSIHVKNERNVYKIMVDRKAMGKEILKQIVGMNNKFILLDENDNIIKLTCIMEDIIQIHGNSMKIIPKDMVGAGGDGEKTNGNNKHEKDDKMIVDNPEENEGDKKVGDTVLKDTGMYQTHHFDEDMGFDSIADMIKRPSELLTEEKPRHLVIGDVGDIKFSKHPKRMLMPVMIKYLGIGQHEDRPNIYMFKEKNTQKVCIEVKEDKHATKLLNTTMIYGVGVDVKPHPFGNSSRATVWDSEGIFAAFSDEELERLLRDHGVITVVREKYKDRKTNELRPGRRYRITFKTKIPPKYLKFPDLGIQMRTELYVPPPLRCHRCQKFGHYQTNCRILEKDSVCFICSRVHEDKISKCKEKAQCVNCKGPHISSSPLCPAFKQEKAMKTEAVEQRCAPLQVIRDWKSNGKYVDYSKSTAQIVTASESKDKGRTDKMEIEIHEIKKFLKVLVDQSEPNQRSHPSLDERSVEEVHTENKVLVEKIQELTVEVNDAHEVKEDIIQLKQEMQKMREENEALKTNRDEVQKLRQTYDVKCKEKDSSTEQMTSQIVDLTQKFKNLEIRLNEKDAEILGWKEKCKATETKSKKLVDDLKAEVALLKQERVFMEDQLKEKEVKMSIMQSKLNEDVLRTRPPSQGGTSKDAPRNRNASHQVERDRSIQRPSQIDTANQYPPGYGKGTNRNK